MTVPDVVYAEQEFGSRTLMFDARTNAFEPPPIIAPVFTTSAPVAAFLAAQEGGGFLYVETTGAPSSITAFPVLDGLAVSGSSVPVPSAATVFPGSQGQSTYIWQQAPGSASQSLSVFAPNLAKQMGAGPTVATGISWQVPDPLSLDAYVLDSGGTLHRLHGSGSTYSFTGASASNVFAKAAIPGTFASLAIHPNGMTAYATNGSAITIVATPTMVVTGSIAVTDTALALATSANGGTLYELGFSGTVGSATFSAHITLINTVSNKAASPVTIPTKSGEFPTGFALTPDGAELLVSTDVTTTGTSNLYVLNSASGALITVVAAPAVPSPGLSLMGNLVAPMPIPSPAPTPVPSPTPAPSPVGSLPPCSVVSQTNVTSPSNRTRTTIGVDELVELTSGGKNITWTLAGSGNISKTAGGSTMFTAPDTAGTSTITASGVGCQSTNIMFTVIAPSGVINVQLAGTSIKHTQGFPDLGFQTQAFLTPDTVSFSNIRYLELDTPCVCSGYYAPGNGQGHNPDTTPIQMLDDVPGFGTPIDGLDTAYFGVVANDPAPFQPGKAEFDIPNDYVTPRAPTTGVFFFTSHQVLTLTAASGQTNGTLLNMSKSGAVFPSTVASPTSVFTFAVQ